MIVPGATVTANGPLSPIVTVLPAAARSGNPRTSAAAPSTNPVAQRPLIVASVASAGRARPSQAWLLDLRRARPIAGSIVWMGRRYLGYAVPFMAPRSDPVISGADPMVAETLTEVIVVGTADRASKRERVEIELDELEELARTLGARVVERRLVTLREAHPATFLRGGVVEELKERIGELGKPAVLANDNLTPRQQRNLQQEWNVPVLDRTEVILGIFARRARTAEGRVQIEMAQLEHLLPRRGRPAPARPPAAPPPPPAGRPPATSAERRPAGTQRSAFGSIEL